MGEMCVVCGIHKVAKMELKSNHKGMCHSCSVMDDMMRGLESTLNIQSPNGKDLQIIWKYVDSED